MKEAEPVKPAPHPAAAAAAIAGMSLLVAGVLEVLGPLRVADELLAARIERTPLGIGARPPQMVWVWAWTVPVTFGVAWAVLHVREVWQRWVLVLTSFVLTLCWLPVLWLLGVEPAPAVPLVALLWVSSGALVYAARHSISD